MLYHFYEWNHAALTPLRAVADATRLFYKNPLNPLSQTAAGRTIAAMAEVFERTTRVYGKPEFGLNETVVDGQRVPVADKVVWEKPFARLLRFERELPRRTKRDPRFLIVAPMSGHYATLLRGTVEALLPYADVHITDWTDARKVPLAAGRFDLDDYVDYVIEMLQFLGPDTHVIAVCQPAVPVLMAVAVMEEAQDPAAPATMTLMGGPIDTRINPTAVNKLAEEKGIDWFRQNVVMPVPFPQPGFMRMVYPGFLQLSGFMSMNLDRHMIAQKDFFWHLVKNDGDLSDKHREFYDEYNAVMDLTAEFYLQTVEEVFIKHSLPKGEITHRGKRVDTTKIVRTALLTVEGENDDISGVGQTRAAHTLCASLSDDKRVHYLQPKVGHYGVFNGSRFRAEIAPRIVDFALTHGTTHSEAALPRKAAVIEHAQHAEAAPAPEPVAVEAVSAPEPEEARPLPVAAEAQADTGPEASFVKAPEPAAESEPDATAAEAEAPALGEVVPAPEASAEAEPAHAHEQAEPAADVLTAEAAVAVAAAGQIVAEPAHADAAPFVFADPVHAGEPTLAIAPDETAAKLVAESIVAETKAAPKARTAPTAPKPARTSRPRRR
nr:polyhydroxyalkanoate depolymerase [Aurantimonas sp. Leaf443]